MSRAHYKSVSADSGLGTCSRDSDVSTEMSAGRDSADSGFVEYDFLFPHGIMISHRCSRQSILADVKPVIWDEVVKKVGAKFLRDSSHYVIIGRTSDNAEVEVDERSRLSDLQLVSPVLEVSEPICSRDLNELYNKTSDAIGIPIQTIEQMDGKFPDLKQFRRELMHVCRDIASVREQWSEDERLRFHFPPKMDLNKDLPSWTERKILKAKNIIPEVHVYLIEPGDSQMFNVQVHATDSPAQVIEAAVAERCKVKGYDEETTRRRVEGAGSLYVLKVCGREDYMLDQICIHSYEYVRTCINRDEIPKLQMVTRENLVKQLPVNTCVILQQELPPRPEPEILDKSSNTILSWDIPYDSKYSIKVRTQPGRKQQYIDCEMFVEAQLFNGEQALCEPMRTYEHGYNTAWAFDVAVQSLPRNARLCFMTFTMRRGEKVKNLNWVNMQVFDQSGRLVTGLQSMKVFDFPETVNVMKYPQGTPGSNWDSTAHVLEFEVISPWSKEVIYPPFDYIDNCIHRMRKNSESGTGTTPFARLDELLAKDPRYKLTRDEQFFLWKNRHKARDYSQKLLPKLISAVDWKDRHQVFQLHELLSPEPGRDDTLDIITLPTALQLLSPACPSIKARELAVEWMRRKLDPVQIELFLLQLVQILKFECYRDNAFTKFLLEKALLYQKIGHTFFWLLRAEIDNPASRPRFVPLLESYCLHCGSDVLDQRLKEVAALKQFSSITTAIKDPNTPQKEHKTMLSDWVGNSSTVLEQQPSLMHPSIMLNQFIDEDCKVLGSKMKPLFLTWASNHNPSCAEKQPKVRYIVKNGDDLRQDMLVIQMLKVMDMLWKSSASDLRPTIYDCLALNSNIGLIEVVQNAQTLCEIQRETNKGATDNTGLHQWLYEKTKDTIGFPEGVKHFIHSCAGFIVTTFLLGVGDRHSDNIMVTESGEIFNIDFGHFMNHRKAKAGIRRERTPFILTKDFVNIITQGAKEAEKHPTFEYFLYLCFEAYMTIRVHSDLIISLLSLMMHADLPELSEEKEIRYCQECLGVGMTDTEAVKMFYTKIMESYKGQWSTKINWFFHMFNKEMKSGQPS